MAPAAAPLVGSNGPPGPHPSFIEVAKPYIFQPRIDRCLAALGIPESREDSIRLQGVQLIDTVRKSLQLPVRTFNTACVYYHKFRLVHAENEYNMIEAALAALFTACKIEDTLKKSREIICASFNLKLSPADHLSPDDAQFDAPSKAIIGLERQMLEGAGFDFRTRQPQKLVIKLSRWCGFAKDHVAKTAYAASLDLDRTFAPLKQTTAAMAIACVELAARLCDSGVRMECVQAIDYEKWDVSRAEVMETMLDLLDLYTHHRHASLVGPNHPLDTYINVRIALNHESKEASLPRYTPSPSSPSSSVTLAADVTPVSSFSSPTSATLPNKHPPLVAANGVQPGRAMAPAGRSTDNAQQQQLPQSRSSAAAPGSRNAGTVRFMLDAARALDEKRAVAPYFGGSDESDSEPDMNGSGRCSRRNGQRDHRDRC